METMQASMQAVHRTCNYLAQAYFLRCSSHACPPDQLEHQIQLSETNLRVPLPPDPVLDVLFYVALVPGLHPGLALGHRRWLIHELHGRTSQTSAGEGKPRRDSVMIDDMIKLSYPMKGPAKSATRPASPETLRGSGQKWRVIAAYAHSTEPSVASTPSVTWNISSSRPCNDL